jgi:hypothetical protein
VSIEPQRTTDVTKVLYVITKEDRMEDLFKKIAVYGHTYEEMRHIFLGQKRDTLCLPEILLFIAKGKDPVFSYLCVEPLSIIKEAFYYAVGVDTTQTDEKERIAMKKGMNLLTFYQFMANIFMFSRLWQIFAAADDGIEDEYISKDEFCRAKGKLESMGGVKIYREMTDAQWARGFNYIDDNKDEQIEYSEFVHFCVKFIITPEEYLIKAVSVSAVKRGTVYDHSSDALKPLLHRHTITKQQSSLESLVENGNEEENDNDNETDKILLQQEKENHQKSNDDESFDRYLQHVKKSQRGKMMIVRNYSDLSSRHGCGELPSPEDLAFLEEKTIADETRISIEEWTDKRMADYNRQPSGQQSPYNHAGGGGNRPRSESESEVDFDRYTTEQRNIVQGYMNMESLHDYDVDDNTSVQSVISASTLLSNAHSHSQQSKEVANHLPQSSLRLGDDDLFLQTDNTESSHQEYYDNNLNCVSADSPCQSKNRSKASYRQLQNPPEQTFGHLRNPKTLEPIDNPTQLKKFIKDRETRRHSMHDMGVISSLSCNVKRSVIDPADSEPGARYQASITSPISTMNHINSNSIHSKVMSFDDDVSEDEDDNISMSSNGSQALSSPNTVGSHTDDPTCTPHAAAGMLDEEGERTQPPERINVISLIEKMILAQFETPEARTHRDLFPEEDEYSVSVQKDLDFEL